MDVDTAFSHVITMTSLLQGQWLQQLKTVDLIMHQICSAVVNRNITFVVKNEDTYQVREQIQPEEAVMFSFQRLKGVLMLHFLELHTLPIKVCCGLRKFYILLHYITNFSSFSLLNFNGYM